MFYNSQSKNYLNCYKKIKNCTIYSSIDEIDEKVWQSLNCDQNYYYHKDFLKSIENNHSEIRFFYIVLFDENETPKAFASLQVIDFYLDTIQNDLELLIRKIKNIGRKLHVLPKKKPLQLLICGNTFVSGEHGLFIKNKYDKKKTIKEMAKAILSFTNNEKKLKIDAFLLKDFQDESLFISDELKAYNYNPFSVEPNMVMSVNEKWKNFDDYLAAMKTKFRVKAKKALQLSNSLRIENITDENIENQLPNMKELYEKVAIKASFNLSFFNLNTYKDLKKKFGENYVLKTFWLNDKIVGFMSGIINNNSLDAHFVGLDYAYNRSHAVYQKMLYDYVEIAISRELNTINFGRTASEIKSSVGATPQNLTMYLRHKKSITNKILKLFLQRIQPTPFQQKFPFKK